MNNKKPIIISSIIAIIIILICLIAIFLKSKSINDNNTTTTSTTAVKKDYSLKDEASDISITFNDEKYINGYKLNIKKVENVTNIENVVEVYDIDLLDKDNNIVKVDNTSLIVSIPFNNTENYNDFKVLYLNDNNEVKETISAIYKNGKVEFRVSHLSRYAIIATKKEENTTTTTTTTTSNN